MQHGLLKVQTKSYKQSKTMTLLQQRRADSFFANFKRKLTSVYNIIQFNNNSFANYVHKPILNSIYADKLIALVVC